MGSLIGDGVLIYVLGHGFFATARIASLPKPRRGWKNRYPSDLDNIRLIRPPVSLELIRERAPQLTWAIYPRSLTTPVPDVTEQVRNLVRNRRQFRGSEISEEELNRLDVLNVAETKVARWAHRKGFTQPFAPFVMRQLPQYGPGATRKAANCAGCPSNLS